MQPAASDLPLQLRPRRATELIDVAFQLWRRTFRSLLTVGGIVGVVFAGVSAISTYNSIKSAEFNGYRTSVGTALGPLSVVMMFVYSLALIPVLHNAFVGGDSPVGSSLKRGLRQGPRAVLYTLASIVGFFGLALVGLFVFGLAAAALTLVAKIGGVVGIVIIVVVGIALYIFALVVLLGIGARFQVGVVALVIEHEGVFDAIRRGFRLTQGRWIAFGGTQAIVLVLSYLVIGIPTGIAFGVANNTDSRPIYFAIATFFGSLMYIFWWAPMYTGLGVSMYVDGRVRLEAIDLDTLTDKLSDGLSDGWSPAGS
jgi:hypothetical protein